MTYFDDVREWHRAAGIPLADGPIVLPVLRMVFRSRLTIEEFREFQSALTICSLPEEIPNVAKEAADLIVTVLGAMAEMGIPFDAVWQEVHRSNMAKVGPDGVVVKRENGKILKPEGWQPPDVAAVLASR